MPVGRKFTLSSVAPTYGNHAGAFPCRLSLMTSGLRVDGLHKKFGDIVALNGVDLEVPRGQLVGFLGPNGAGKTTAMRGILGLVAMDAGSVTWDGRPMTEDDRHRVGYMPQDDAFERFNTGIVNRERWYQEPGRAGRREDRRTRGQEDRKTGGQEDRRTGRREDVI